MAILNRVAYKQDYAEQSGLWTGLRWTKWLMNRTTLNKVAYEHGSDCVKTSGSWTASFLQHCAGFALLPVVPGPKDPAYCQSPRWTSPVHEVSLLSPMHIDSACSSVGLVSHSGEGSRRAGGRGLSIFRKAHCLLQKPVDDDKMLMISTAIFFS